MELKKRDSRFSELLEVGHGAGALMLSPSFWPRDLATLEFGMVPADSGLFAAEDPRSCMLRYSHLS
jgi:hypothetical protein